MLHLKRITSPHEWIRCKISKEIMVIGDYYYEDDEDGLIVKATVYKEMMNEKREREFDYSKLEKAQSEQEYRNYLKEYEREFLTQDLVERKVFHKEKGGY